MSITRREFLKLSLSVGAAGTLGGVVSGVGCAVPETRSGGKKTYTVCSLCSLGCGIIIRSKNGIPVHVEGDKDHPVNRGSLCARAFLIPQLFDSSRRLSSVKYRGRGASEWQEISWDKAVSLLSQRIHATRDESFVPFDGSVTVNRADGIAAVAGSNLTNEEAYLAAKFFRLIGVPHVGTESILTGNAAHSASVGTFGMFGATNPWPDLSNTDSILVLGMNIAQRMPVAMRYIGEAKARGAKVICADPVVTESASFADAYIPVRPGTDASFILGIINYALQNGKYNRTYLITNTDASYIVKKDFSYDRRRGTFSGFDGKTKTYPADQFDYERDGRGNPMSDDEIRNPRTVFQILKSHVSAYSPDYVAEITGCTAEQFLRAAELFCENAAMGKTGAVIVGSSLGGDMCAEQTHRALSILQLVLGNIGCSGGGIYHTEAFGNSLGVDYQIPSWNMLPGMIPLPGKGCSGEDSDLALYMRNRTPSSNNPSSVNFWQNLKGYAVSLLRAWYGERGTESSRYNFDWIPKGNSDLTSDEWLSKFGPQYKGAVLLGADLSAYGIPSDMVRRALSSLSWLAVSDIWHTDSSDFWKNIKCDTEVFLFPSVTLFEKEGTMVTSSRWVEKREPVPPLSNKCGSEFTLINDLFAAVKKGCSPASSLPEQITFAAWKYNSPDDVLREMSGYTMKSGKNGIADLSMIKDDGSTACGNILFCGVYPGEPTANTDDATGKTDAKLYPSWGYSIPGNVRVLYNGAGIEKSGYPSDPKRRVISFAEDFSGSDEPHGIENPSMNPFVMNREGTASIFSSTSVYGPLPDQYNTGWGSSSLPENPLSRIKQNRGGFGGSARAVIVGEKRYCLEKITQEAVFSLAGVCEMHPSFAAGKKISTGDTVKVSASGKSVQARALVTERVRSSSDKGSEINMVVLRGGAFREIISDSHSGIVSVDVTKISGGTGK